MKLHEALPAGGSTTAVSPVWPHGAWDPNSLRPRHRGPRAKPHSKDSEMKCQCRKCDQKVNHSGSNLREVKSGKVLTFCCPLCRSLFMRKQSGTTEYRTVIN